MSAEAVLQFHWRGITESHDPVGLTAFADHLQERWHQAVQEDAEYLRKTGRSMPDVLRLNGWPTFRARYIGHTGWDGDWFQFVAQFVPVPGVTLRGRTAWQSFTFGGLDRHPPPPAWEYDRLMAFIAWLWEILRPADPA